MERGQSGLNGQYVLSFERRGRHCEHVLLHRTLTLPERNSRRMSDMLGDEDSKKQIINR